MTGHLSKAKDLSILEPEKLSQKMETAIKNCPEVNCYTRMPSSMKQPKHSKK